MIKSKLSSILYKGQEIPTTGDPSSTSSVGSLSNISQTEEKETASYDVESLTSKEQNLFHWVAKMKAEVKGVEPITDEEKTDTNIFSAANTWFSSNLVLSAFAVGALGPCVYGLNFGASCLTILFFNILGVIPVAFFSMFGARTGLRQMILTRYLTGNYIARFFSLINIISCVGWCVLNTICSAELLNMVNRNGHNCPLWAGCLIIAAGTVLISFFGYNVIHQYEKWSWIPNLAIFFVLIARLKISGKWSNGEWPHGPTTAGHVLSFGCAAFGYAGAWTTYAADYTVYLPRSTSKAKIFFNVFISLTTALCFSMFLGAACGMGAVADPEWMKLYHENAIGGLVYAVLVPKSLHGFGQFCCVVFAMSTVANNLPSMYTIALSAQALWGPLERFPRAIWSIAGNLALLGLGIPACYFFDTFLENFMDTISYYCAIYITLIFSEHCIHRRGNYDSYVAEDWNNASKLPLGIASALALFISAFGVALGMCQTYWIGEIGILIGKDGGDVGLEMGASWAFIVYNLVRPLEKKYIGR
ncbi:hypothetical protein RI543_004422 [Arxiozyma heterogenica]|uniref:Purine-cytosine permease n=1 Tax=Arxiozyma heterogenica TaxID=278026 RepID=A0AAN7ZX40_9SACH|nr:hypothetical protein RI543_004422 [Kazachstania heterogenica]